MDGKMIVRRLSKQSGGAGAQTILMDAYPRAIHIIWDRFSALAVNADVTLCEIGIRLGVSDYILRANKLATAGQTLTVTSPCKGYGEFQPFARFTGTAAGEMLEFYAYGREVD